MADLLRDLASDLQTQRAFLKDREPVYERLLALLEDAVRGEFGARLSTLWAGRTFQSVYERPLLLLAAIRFDALMEGEGHPLFQALSGPGAQVDAMTPGALAAALAPTRRRLERALAKRAVQTNETTRAVAWLWPAHLLWEAGVRRPLTLVDLGTSAGLNLVADDLPALWTDDTGRSIALDPRPAIAYRLGLDISPLDVRRPDDAMWLRACVWPSDRTRLERLEQAIAAFAARAGHRDAPALEVCGIADVPGRLASLPADAVVLSVQTIVRDYLAPSERERFDAGMREFLLARPACSVLMMELEVDRARLDVPDESATLTARCAGPGAEIMEFTLARTHPHPRRLAVDRQAVTRIVAAFGRDAEHSSPAT